MNSNQSVVVPQFSLVANGKDVTEHIRDNLISLTLIDEDGEASDELSFSVAGIFARPLFGDTLELKLGVKNNLNNYGQFKVYGTSLDHKSMVTTVRASSVDFSGNIKEKRNKLWEHVTLANIVQLIAQSYGMEANTKNADINIKSCLQKDTDDLAFLKGLANKYGFIFVVKHNILAMIPKCSDYTFSCEVDISDCLSLSIDRTAKMEYGSVELHWWDVDTATMMSAVAGYGAPVYHINNQYPQSEVDAYQIASAKLSKLANKSTSGSLSIVGGRNILAGGKLVLRGAGSDDGNYHMNTVTHSMNTSSYTVDIQFTGIKDTE